MAGRVSTLVRETLPAHPMRDALCELLIRALQPDPEDRYQCAQDFHCALLQSMQVSIGADTTQRTPYASTVAVHMLPPKEPSCKANREPNDGTERTLAPALSPQHLLAIEQSLATFMGPLAKILVKRSISEATCINQFTQALAKHIPSTSERQAIFLELKRLGIDQRVGKQQDPYNHHSPAGYDDSSSYNINTNDANTDDRL